MAAGPASSAAGRRARRPRRKPSRTLAKALEAGTPVDAPAGGIAADTLAPRRVGELVFPIARRFVERVVLVSDAAIRAAQQALWEHMRIVAEPGGAAAFAALLSGRYRPNRGEQVGVLVSGGNTTAVDFGRDAAASASQPTPSASGNATRVARRAPQQPLLAPLRH